MAHKHGWYSVSAAFNSGTFIWSTPDGKEVQVTGVDSNREKGEEGYKWKDKIYVGEVCEFLREGMEISNPLIESLEALSDYYEDRYLRGEP